MATQTVEKMPDNVWEGPWERNEKIVDLNDLDTFVTGYPYEKMKEVQSQPGLYWNMEKEAWGPGFWNVTRYNDIIEISRRPETFSSADGINISYGPDADPAVLNAVVGNMIAMDPPEHRDYRAIAQPFFMNSSIKQVMGRVHELAREVVENAVAKAKEQGEIDFMVDVAAPLPINVLCDILGVPHEDWKKIFDWSNELIGLFDPDLCEDPEAATGTFMELFLYGQHMIEDRRANPRKDLMTAIANAKPEDGGEIPEHLLNGFFLLMVIAGNETTRNSLSGGMKALIEHPEQREKLVGNLDLMPTAVEEILRWVSPVNHMRRTALEDTELGGQKIAKGEKLVMWYGMGNRDPEIFENPWSFDVARDPNPHIAFGIGEHFCLGARLARLQLNLAFTELIKQVPGLNLELTGDVTWVRTNFINGIKAMPVKMNF